MSNSYKYFENRDCKYYPCHKEVDKINCLFCYCPMYFLEQCLGKPEYKEKDGCKIKVCTNCNFPHKEENYDLIIERLKKETVSK